MQIFRLDRVARRIRYRLVKYALRPRRSQNIAPDRQGLDLDDTAPGYHALSFCLALSFYLALCLHTTAVPFHQEKGFSLTDTHGACWEVLKGCHCTTKPTLSLRNEPYPVHKLFVYGICEWAACVCPVCS